METREIVCMFYNCEGECELGREGTFRHYCQKCKQYKAKKNAVPARKNNKAARLDAINRREAKREIKNY